MTLALVARALGSLRQNALPAMREDQGKMAADVAREARCGSAHVAGAHVSMNDGLLARCYLAWRSSPQQRSTSTRLLGN